MSTASQPRRPRRRPPGAGSERFDPPWPGASESSRRRRPARAAGMVAWIGERGEWRVAEAERTERLVVWELPPVRTPYLHRGSRTIRGWYASRSTGRHIAYESAAERDVLLELDFDPGALGVAGQPLVVRDGERHDHAPDLGVLGRDRRVSLVEVKRDREQADAYADSGAAQRLREVCAAAGWHLEVRSPAAPTRLANLRWLRGCRPRPAELSQLRPVILAAAAGGESFGALARLADEVLSRPVVGSLAWSGELGCALDAPLCDSTVMERVA